MRQSNTDFTGLISRRMVRSVEVDHLLAALGEIRVRIFLEQHDDVGGGAALVGEMAMRIELDADHAAFGPTSARTRSRKSPSQSS